MLQKDIFIYETNSIKDALKKLDKTAERVLLIADKENRLLGTITDGDIRRYILKGKSVEDNIKNVYHKTPKYVRKRDFSIEKIKKELIKHKIDLLPIVDDENRVVDFITWDQAFSGDKNEPVQKAKLDVPVVIMAGGKGTRLDLFTRILPKPLIPINDKPVIEMIIEEFKRHGVGQYYLVLNYKGEMIEAYLDNIEKDYEVQYVREDKFLGTAGGLRLLEKAVGETFIVSNCDVIVKADFEEVIALHKKQNASMTILSSIQHYKIPYGVIHFREKGEVTHIIEKPEYTMTVNTGVYVFGKDCLRYIPKGHSLDMSDLIKDLLKNNKKIITYPVNESDYIDIGQWEEYKKTVERFKSISSYA